LYTWVVEVLQGRKLGFLYPVLVSPASNSYSSSGTSGLPTPVLLCVLPKHNTRWSFRTYFPPRISCKVRV